MLTARIHKTLDRSSNILLAGGLLTVVILAVGQAPPLGGVLNSTSLQPSQSFIVDASEESRLLASGSTKDSLYFLVGREHHAEIIVTTSNGVLIRKIPLQMEDRKLGSLHMAVAENGEVAVLAADTTGARTIHLVDTTFVSGPPTPVAHFFADIAYVGSKLVALKMSDSLLLGAMDSRTFLSLSPRLDGAVSLVRMPDGNLGLIEETSARFRVVSASGIIQHPHILEAPEIQGVPRISGPRLREIVVASVSVSPSGHIFALPSVSASKKGAAVLEFDGAGKFLKRFRCQLPLVESSATQTPRSRMLATGILSLGGDRIALVGQRERMCAIYDIRMPGEEGSR